MITLGLDLSLNHGGAVALDDSGNVLGYWFVSDKVAAVKAGATHGTRLPVSSKKNGDPEIKQIRRQLFWCSWLREIMVASDARFVGLEGYAFGATSNSAYQYGELGGLARMEIIKAGGKLRVHDPLSVKLFASGKGNATSDKLVEKLPEALRTPWVKVTRQIKGIQVAEDLADAYWLARLVWFETQIRTGEVLIKDLPEHQIRVFNRVTKTYPVNLLDREWLKL